MVLINGFRIANMYYVLLVGCEVIEFLVFSLVLLLLRHQSTQHLLMEIICPLGILTNMGSIKTRCARANLFHYIHVYIITYTYMYTYIQKINSRSVDCFPEWK